MYIERINSPSDLKKLSFEECLQYIQEIRKVLIMYTSKNGGHLASNLGVVELTVALHYVFDSPSDPLIFDTSHQCYTHKIITGRKNAYLENNRTVTGYTNPRESVHDFFEYGHTSTAISLACGMAKEITQYNRKIIAIVGDGALGGGEALEGLNIGVAEHLNNLVIIVNDNDMSIAENHGGLYSGLKRLRESKGKEVNNIFTFLGYEYHYLDDGHNFFEIVKKLKLIKKINKPIVLHVHTCKGAGYDIAEENPEDNHFVKPFNIGEVTKKSISKERYDIIARDYLLEEMKKDRRIKLITAAMPVVLSLDKEIRKEMRSQYIDVGIAEEAGISFAGGIAKAGGCPVFFTRSTFFQRAYDQISQELCLNNLAVTLLVINASIYSPTDKTHIGIYDIAMLSNIPNLIYLAPINKEEYLSMLRWSIKQSENTVAIKVPRKFVSDSCYDAESDYAKPYKFKKMVDGEKIAIIGLGDFFQLAENVANELNDKYNISCTLINPRYANAVDSDMLEELQGKHSIIVTLENGIIEGGFGQKISSFCSLYDIKVINLGFKKEYFDSYETDKVLDENGLHVSQIVDRIIAVLKGAE